STPRWWTAGPWPGTRRCARTATARASAARSGHPPDRAAPADRAALRRARVPGGRASRPW
ncbi:hypothetical protein ACIQRF_20765, partial [Streptomyces avermitilis]